MPLNIDYLRGLVAAIDGLRTVRSHIDFAEQFAAHVRYDPRDMEHELLLNARANLGTLEETLVGRVLNHIRSEGEQHAREEFRDATQASKP